MDQTEKALRAYWEAEGVPKQRQDEVIASIAAKAQPRAKVGPFTIGEQTDPHQCFSDARTWQDGKRHCQKCGKPLN